MKLNKSRLRRLIISEMKKMGEETNFKATQTAGRTQKAGDKRSDEDREEELVKKILDLGGIEPEPMPHLYLIFKHHLMELIKGVDDGVGKDLMLSLDDASNGNFTPMHDALKQLKNLD